MKKSKKSEKCSKKDNVIKLSDYQHEEVVEDESYISLDFEDDFIEKIGVDLTEEDIKVLADSLVNSLFGEPDEEN